MAGWSCDMDNLDPFTRDVLWLVAHGGPYHSSVMITDDLVDNGRLKMGSLDGSGGWFLVQDTLHTLNELNLVVYSVAPYGVFTRVRCTPEGYAHTGMPHAVREVGATHSRGGNESDHPGDPTDWRNHGYTAVGGPVERMPLREHILKYWDHAHLHLEMLWEIEERTSHS